MQNNSEPIPTFNTLTETKHIIKFKNLWYLEVEAIE